MVRLHFTKPFKRRINISIITVRISKQFNSTYCNCKQRLHVLFMVRSSKYLQLHFWKQHNRKWNFFLKCIHNMLIIADTCNDWRIR